MGLVTEKITYNVHDRGRKHRGIDRHFDCVALARLFNGASVQEKVRKGDMLGYYGHWPRQVFGMQTREGGIMDGKAVPLPLATRTVFLSADNAGNVTHQIEFLDTDAGLIAEKMYLSKAGGFSSAIIPVPGTSPVVPESIEGWDAVLEPNYDSNRGYRGVMDSVDGPNAAMLLDAVMAEQASASAHLMALLDATSDQLVKSIEALSHTARENDLLISRLASGKGSMILDDIVGTGSRSMQGNRAPDFARFASKPLVPFQALDSERAPAVDPLIARLNAKH